MPFASRKYIKPGYLLATIILTSLVGATLFMHVWQQRVQHDLELKDQEILIVEQIWSEASGMEAQARGYMLTADAHFLQDFELQKKRSLQLIDSLEILGADAGQSVSDIRQSLGERIKWLDIAVVQFQKEPQAASLKNVVQQGREQMMLFHQEIIALENRQKAERKVLDIRFLQVVVNYRILSLALLVGFILLMMGVYESTRHYVSNTLSLNKIIRASEAKLRNLLEGSHDPIIGLDANYQVTVVNQPFQQLFLSLFGKPIEVAYLFQDILEENTPFAEVFHSGWDRAMAGEAFVQEVKLVLKDASKVDYLLSFSPIFDESKRVAGASLIAKDISARKAVEDATRKIDNLLEAVGSMAKIGGWEMDLSTNKLVWSKLVREIHEVPPEFVPDAGSAFQFFPGEASRQIYEAVMRCRDEGIGYDLVLPFLTYEGNFRWVRAMGKPILQNDNVLAIIGAFQDITFQKKQADAYKASRDELEKISTELESQNKRMSHFAHIAAHDLRTPVANLEALTKMMHDAIGVEEQALIWRKIETSTQRMKLTLNNLLDSLVLSEEEVAKIKPEALAMEEVIQSVLANLENRIEDSKVAIDYDFARLPFMQSDKVAIESILLNLVSNAIKYRSTERPALISISGRAESDKAILVVADNGQGIDLGKYRESLFGYLRTFHDNDEAIGIGLYITRNQVVALHGTIEVESEVGKGTRFTISLPHAVFQPVTENKTRKHLAD